MRPSFAWIDLRRGRSLAVALRQWLPTVVLAVAAAATAWLLHRNASAPPDSEPTDKSEPDYYVEGFSTVTMTESGVPKRKLVARRLVHFPDTDTNELLEPYMVLFHPTRPPWHVESERGWVSSSGKVVLLLGKVHAWRSNESGERILDIRTRDLRILTDSDYGETDQFVRIRSRNTESTGVGMRAYMQENRVELLSQVQTVYRKDATEIP